MKASMYKIALIFSESGFLEEERFRAMLREAGKSLTEILFSDFSGRSVKDLITYEIPLPFTKSKRDRMKAELRRDLNISPEELRAILKMHPQRVPELCQILEEAGLLWPDTAKQVREGIAQGGEAHIEAMLRDMVITVETLATFIGKENWISRGDRRRRAAHLLTHNGILEEDVVQRILEAHANQEGRLSDLLQSVGGISQFELLQAIRSDLHLPKVNLTTTEIDHEVVTTLPAQFQRRHLTMPFRRIDGAVCLAMSDPLDTALTDALELLTGQPHIAHFASQRDLIGKLNIVLPTAGSAPAMAIDEEGVHVDPFDSSMGAETVVEDMEEDTDTLVDNISTVELVSTVIESAFATRATDIHLEPLQDEVRVRYRIDGRLKTIMQFPREMLLPVVSRVKVLCDLNVTERRRPQDGHFSIDLGADSVDLRVSVLPTHLGEKVVIRVLDEANVLRGLGDLGMPDSERGRIGRLLSKPHGMLIVGGPTGSGKTTTLYAGLNSLNSEDRNIVTIEDPVEYRIGGISQIQVDPKIDLTFATGLRATLRQDPDIIMVGEIRDTETAKIAVRSALTGHLVLSTLHANSSAGVVSALRHMGIPAFSVASSLIGVISQRLVRRLCTDCREAFTPKKALKEDLGLPPGTRRQLWKPVGCERCLDMGYRGRLGIFEVWEINAAMREVILNDGSETALTEAAQSGGMRTLMENAHHLLHEGITSPAEVLRSVSLD
ncbi:Flp pilus assembly complex ATPase component TadA [Candidatus Sumerlaeota bacterium]|nr:Flp pilus assembly complex ATPase component TadA [Candidatus Sumerlaeota bacterium]